jgi:hypothetical protein
MEMKTRLQMNRTLTELGTSLVMHVLSEAFPVLVLIKMGTALTLVMLLTFLAEVVSTRFAGILSGYPMGAALSLFFMGYEISPQFAAESALYTSLGLIATQTFGFCYYQSSLMAQTQNKTHQILYATFGGLAGYFLAASMLQLLEVSFLSATLLPVLAIVLFNRLFRNAENLEIERKMPISLQALAMRATCTACIIVLITFTANWFGPNWAGLFTAFPMTMLPLLIIIHLSYDSGHVHAILKNFPRGLGALVAYSLAVALCYPTYGIYLGTFIAYGLATLYLVLLRAGEFFGKNWIDKFN